MALGKYRNVVQFGGNALPGVQILVRRAGSTELGSLWSDLDGTMPLPNPFTNNPTFGSLEFYAEDGLYDIYPTKSGYEMEVLRNEQVGVGGVLRNGPLYVDTVNGAGVIEVVGAIPEGAKDVGVYVTNEIGFGSTGLMTGYDVGDGAVQDVWGANIPLTQGHATEQGDFNLAPGTLLYPLARSVFLTAVGGLFDAVGRARVVVTYRLEGP